MKSWLKVTLFFGVIGVSWIIANSVQAASGTSCNNFNGTIPEPPNDATCTLRASATDPENDRVYYVFTWGDGTTTRVPNASIACAGQIGATATVPSGTECSADHTYTTIGNPFTVFATAYDEANHESVASSSVPVFITSQILGTSLTGTPTTDGWYNYITFDWNASCQSDASETLTYCRTEVSIDNGVWNPVPGGDPNVVGQSTYSYSGSYTYPTDGASYRFRSTADDTGGSPVVFSTIIPVSGQIQIDQSPPLVLASSPSANQNGAFVVSATLVDYPNPGTGPNSGVSSWQLQYSINGGSSWTDCRNNIGAGLTSINFGSGCTPSVTLVPNTTYCFQARAQDSTSPTPNQGNYIFDADTMCTPYQVSSPPIAPHTPTPSINSLVSASNINLQWYGGDADSSESLDYSVYISQPNQGVNVPADLDGQLLDQLPCSSQLPQGCQVTYGAPQGRNPQAGEVYAWRVQVEDGTNPAVDSTPIPWSFIVNTPPTVSNVSIAPAVINSNGTITWYVTDPNDSQSLSFNVYYGPLPDTTNGTTPIISGLTTSSCVGGPNSTGWDCTYVWDTACVPQISGQYVTVVAYDGLDSSVPVSSLSTFAVDHTNTYYWPGPGDTDYDSVGDSETKNFTIDYGSIEADSSFIKFVGSCSAVTADANAPGNAAICGGTGPSCATNPDVALEDLIAGTSNSVNFSLQGCVSTQYRIRYNLVSSCNEPYVSVEEGSIYSQENIRAQYVPPQGYFNATYLILGGGTSTQPRVIQNFISQAPSQGVLPINPNFGQMSYPGISSGATPQVSSFDYYGLTHNLSGTEVIDTGINSYGHQVEITTGSGIINLSDVLGGVLAPLAGKVYWVKGDLDISQAAEFVNGTGNISGAGLIIVEGNLTINANTTYAASPPNISARNLASVGWLVKGNVTVSGGVSQAVGSFFVSGSPSGGVFSTGTSPQQLTIYGAVIARQLQLQRTSSAGGQASEKVVADGRILLNTPPGFKDILQTLPTWQFRTP